MDWKGVNPVCTKSSVYVWWDIMPRIVSAGIWKDIRRDE